MVGVLKHVTHVVLAAMLAVAIWLTVCANALPAETLLTALIAPFGFLNRIRYGEGELTVRTFFGRVHELTWRDVTALTTWKEDGALFIRTGRKTFWLASASLGCEEFLQYAAQQCGQYGVRPQAPKGPRK